MVEKKIIGFSSGKCRGNHSTNSPVLNLDDPNRISYELFAYEDCSTKVICDSLRDDYCKVSENYSGKCIRKKY